MNMAQNNNLPALKLRQAGGEPFEEKMARLTIALREQTEQSAKLDQIIRANLEDIGYRK